MDSKIQIISTSKEIEEDRNWLKILGLFFFNLAAGTGMFYFWGDYLRNLNSIDFTFFVIFLFIFLVLTVLDVFLIKSKWKILLFTFFGFLFPIVINFFSEFKKSDVTILRVAVLLLLLSFYFIWEGKRKGRLILNNFLEIKFFFISKVVLKKAITGTLLFLVFIVYLSFFVWKIGDQKIGQKLVNSFIDDSKYLVNIYLPGVSFSSDKKMEEVIKSIVLSKIKDQGPFVEEKNGNKIYFSQLPEEMQKVILDKLVAETEQQIKEKFPFFNSQMLLGDFGFKILEMYFSNLEKIFGNYFYLILMLIIFILAKGVFALFYWLIGLFVFLIIKMLIILGFAYETLETRTRKFIIVG